MSQATSEVRSTEDFTLNVTATDAASSTITGRVSIGPAGLDAEAPTGWSFGPAALAEDEGVGVVARATAGSDYVEVRIVARELAIALGILLGFLLAGTQILKLFGLTQPSLNIAGGVLLFVIAVGLNDNQAMDLTDGAGLRALHFELARCTYCGNCRDACPQEAIEMSTQFENSTANPEDIVIHAEFYLQACRECGAVVGTRREVDVVREKLSNSPVRTNYADYFDLCITCRRKQSIHSPALTLEVVP